MDALERAKSTPGCIYMRPPIEAYGTLEFGKFDEIYEVGYAYAREFLGRLRGEGGLAGIMDPWGNEGGGVDGEGKRLLRGMAPRRASI